MHKLLFLLLPILFSCAPLGSNAVGDYLVITGTLKAHKSLELIGETVTDEIIVKADEKGNIVLFAGSGTMETISVVLSPTKKNELIELIDKTKKWGQTAKRESVEINKYVGHISGSSGVTISSGLSLSFISYALGNHWAGELNFSYYSALAVANNSPNGERELTYILLPSEFDKLHSLLLKTTKFTDAAQKAKNKDHLFQ